MKENLQNGAKFIGYAAAAGLSFTAFPYAQVHYGLTSALTTILAASFSAQGIVFYHQLSDNHFAGIRNFFAPKVTSTVTTATTVEPITNSPSSTKLTATSQDQDSLSFKAKARLAHSISGASFFVGAGLCAMLILKAASKSNSILGSITRAAIIAAPAGALLNNLYHGASPFGQRLSKEAAANSGQEL